MSTDQIITGEKVQQLAEIYLGYPEDFNYNPVISQQMHKCLSIENIREPFDNPKIVFCYGHRIHLLPSIIPHFKNKFILLTHNSDENIVQNNTMTMILQYPMVIRCYSQNLCFVHDKVHSLPIGLANSQWAHGNIQSIVDIMKRNVVKTSKVYFNFSVQTNVSKRLPCYQSLISRIQFLPTIPPVNYHSLLASYEFCICPEGNGVDTHRLWEALYLKCVPIVLKTEFIETLRQYMDLPMVVLNSWDELSLDDLHYDDFTFDMTVYEFNTIAHKILTSVE